MHHGTGLYRTDQLADVYEYLDELKEDRRIDAELRGRAR